MCVCVSVNMCIFEGVVSVQKGMCEHMAVTCECVCEDVYKCLRV